MTSFLNNEKYKRHLQKRYRAEKRFRAYGLAAILTGTLILVSLLGSIIYTSLPAFTAHYVTQDIYLDPEAIDREDLSQTDWRGITLTAFQGDFPDIISRKDKTQLRQLLSIGASDIVATTVSETPALIGTTQTFSLLLSDDVDLLLKGLIDRNLPENERVISDFDLRIIDALIAQGRLQEKFASLLFQAGDSREPEMAGIKSAFVGTVLTILVTLLLSFPVAVAAAIYLEELSPKNRFTDIIEVNINNLAAVPSIVFGLLGLAVFLNFLNFPRSAPLVGGIILALMTLPTIIITTRASLASIPPSIREAALGVGASRLQVITHHVLPLALPGILTGTIIGLARAAGETAPLLMVGMMAFVVDVPTEITEKATVLPAQIFMWANNPERAFAARASAGIVILLTFLLSANALAIYLRKKYEQRW